MKTKQNNIAIMLICTFFFWGCGKSVPEIVFDENTHRVEGVLYEKGSNVKYIYKVNGDNTKELYKEFEYDKIGRISRESWPMTDQKEKAYNDYFYNIQGQLEKISSYKQTPGNIAELTRVVEYSYNIQGDKVKEECKDYQHENVNTSYTLLYYYYNNRLVKNEDYKDNGQQTGYSVYEYSGDVLLKEKLYDMAGVVIWTTEFTFDQDLLVLSITYKDNPKSGFIRDNTRYYDQNDNLIRVIENDAMLSSTLGAAVRIVWDYVY